VPAKRGAQRACHLNGGGIEVHRIFVVLWSQDAFCGRAQRQILLVKLGIGGITKRRRRPPAGLLAVDFVLIGGAG